MNTIYKLYALIIVCYLFISCGNDNKTEPSGNLDIYFSDAPASFSSFYIDIQFIRFKYDSIITFECKPNRQGAYSVLNFANDNDTLLCTVQPPTGKVKSIEIELGSANSITFKNKKYYLPSKTVIIKTDFDIKANSNQRLRLDFNAFASAQMKEDTGFLFTPKFYAHIDTTGGTIQGFVLPKGYKPAIYAISQKDTFCTLPNENGRYLFKRIPQDTYSIYYKFFREKEMEQIIESIKVKTDTITDAGSIYLYENSED